MPEILALGPGRGNLTTAGTDDDRTAGPSEWIFGGILFVCGTPSVEVTIHVAKLPVAPRLPCPASDRHT